MKRINPLTTPATEVVTAKAENNVLGSCPVCLQEGQPAQMRVLSANGIESFVCLNHRICLPTKD
jgi:hypothetical protein